MSHSPDEQPETKSNPSAKDVTPEALRSAHDRTGRLLKSAGLPFEVSEFEDEDAGRTAAAAAKQGRKVTRRKR